MSFIVTGTDTNVGKTVISAWLALHLGYAYWKPIQTGDESDEKFIQKTTHVRTYEEAYRFSAPQAPLIAASLEAKSIDLDSISLPSLEPLVIEGAGGVFVPLSPTTFMIDLFKKLNLPVIVVARTSLGTINHTLLTLSALRFYGISVQGVILNGEKNALNKQAIEACAPLPVIAEFPHLPTISRETLLSIPLPQGLRV